MSVALAALFTVMMTALAVLSFREACRTRRGRLKDPGRRRIM